MGRIKSRGNGQGSAYRRGSTWTAQVIIGWRLPSDPARPPVPIKRTRGGFPTKKDAIAYCPTLMNGGLDPAAPAPRLSAYWDTYLNGEYKRLSASKQTAYKISWNKLKRLHDVPVPQITVDLLRSTVSDACSTYYPARDCRQLLSNLYKLAAADGIANKDLPSFIVLPSLEEHERTPFSDDEILQLWELWDHGDPRAAIPLVMIYTGMMPGEAMNLQAENVDLTARLITHSGLKTKTRKQTPIVIADAILPVLSSLISENPTGKLWRRNKDNFYLDYYAALSAAKCRKLPPYSCRHTTATALAIAGGVAPQTVTKVMRWSTSKMLDRYAHPATADALDAVDAI